jgi:hypothetical protein
MDASNLLIPLDTQNNNNEQNKNKSSVLNNIDTGSVFKKAKEAVNKIILMQKFAQYYFLLIKHTQMYNDVYV